MFIVAHVSCIILQYECTNGRERDGCLRSLVRASVETKLSSGRDGRDSPATVEVSVAHLLERS